MNIKKNVAVFGAGKIGRLVVHLLADCGDYNVVVLDAQKNAAKMAATSLSSGNPLKNVNHNVCDFTSSQEVEKVLEGQDYVLNCSPFYHNKVIAQAACKLKVNYLDLTEDVSGAAFIKKLSAEGHSAFIPQCGLAPGFITIVANHMVSQFDKVNTVKMRVGALPMYPHNRLKYNLTWSTEGLINEYCNLCEVITNGKREFVPALEGEERLNIDGEEYEAFNTSGGLGAFAESLDGKVTNMDYKSIRYPGHREILYTLLHDLKFYDDREGLKKVFERALPHTSQDVVIIFVTVTGEKDGRLSQKSFVKKIYHGEINDEHWGAIQITTAAAICAVLDLHAGGVLPKSGFIRQEDISYDKFITNRFGKYYS